MEKERTTQRQQPLISIIIPVHNVDAYIEQCVRSVCAQTLSNLEIILVDDGSTDESATLCRQFAEQDSRIVFIGQPNRGCSAARNVALDRAHGEWIGFVDSDDWIEPQMYERLYRQATTEDADIAGCSYFRENGEKRTARFQSGEQTICTGKEAVKLLIRDRRLQNYMWNKLYRKSLFDTVRFPEGLLYEDVAVSHRLFYQARRVVLMDEPLYHYRIMRKGSITQDSRINAEKEYQYFLHLSEQMEFVMSHSLWEKAPYFLHKRGVRLISHLLLLPDTPRNQQIISEISSKLRAFPFHYTVEFLPEIFIKRFWMLHHLPSYKLVYRCIKHVASPRSNAPGMFRRISALHLPYRLFSTVAVKQ